MSELVGPLSIRTVTAVHTTHEYYGLPTLSPSLAALRLCISRLVEVFYYWQRRTDRGFQPLRAVHR